MAQLHQRLDWCKQVGGLSFANLAYWFNVPHETVRGWLSKRRFPRDYKLEGVFERLEALELAINEALPDKVIPYEVRQRDRKEYLRGLYAKYARRCGLPLADNP